MFLLFLLDDQLIAQPPETKLLQGQVLNAKTHEPVPYAAIMIKGTSKGILSNENGYFDMTLSRDTCILAISCVGYKIKEEKIVYHPLHGMYYIQLEEEITELEQVTVVSDKERIVRVTDNISSVMISPTLIAKLPNLGEVDVIRSFQLLPGVSATNETSAGLYVRGGTPDQNLILFDGMTIYHVDHFYGFFSAFNAYTIDDIELIKGGFPAKYGGRTSSVMNITGKPADLQKIHAGGCVSFLSVNAYFEAPIVREKISWQIAVRRSYTDLIRTGLYNKIFDLYNEEDNNEVDQLPTGGMGGGMGRGMQQTSTEPKFHFYDINSKLTYKINDKNSVAISFYEGKDVMDNSREMPSFDMGNSESSGSITDNAEWGNIGISCQWKTEIHENFKSNAFISYSKYFSLRDIKTTQDTESDTRSGPGMNTFENNYVEDISFRYRNEWQLSNSNTVEFGIEETFCAILYQLENNDTLTLIDRNSEGLLSSFYLQDKIALFDNKIDIRIGTRLNHFNLTNKFYFEPRTSIVYEPFEKFKLKAAWGIYNQFHTRVIREDVLQGSKDFWLLADDSTISVNSAIHYIAGISYEFNNFLIDIEGFYKDYKGLTEYSMRYTRTPGRMLNGASEDYFFTGTGYAKGIEFLLQKKYGLNTGWIGYTLSEVKQKYPDLNYGKSFYALHDQTHEIKIVYCRTIKRWDISSAFIFATGKPYTAPESEYQLTLLDGSEYNYIHVSEKNSCRLPDYHRLDVAVTYNWKGKYIQNALSFSIFNLYNHKNIWYKEFTIDENTVTVTDAITLGITPNISFSLKF